MENQNRPVHNRPFETDHIHNRPRW